MANELYGSIMRGGVCYGGVGDPAVINQVSDNIAPKQETSIASELIPAGKYFVNSEGKLCQCDVQIASGGTIIIGSNCHLIPDGGVNELNSNTETLTVDNIVSGVAIGLAVKRNGVIYVSFGIIPSQTASPIFHISGLNNIVSGRGVNFVMVNRDTGACANFDFNTTDCYCYRRTELQGSQYYFGSFSLAVE